MNILIFGGTTEGRLLAEALSELGADVTVSVATSLGAEELANLARVTVWIGRKNALELIGLLSLFDLCVDATHPYAAEATRNIRTACERASVPLRRLLRPESEIEGTVQVGSCAQAAAFLAETEGNILLTTGSKELSIFAGLDPQRVFARVLPTHDGISACEALGLPHSHILALQGPFSQKMNEAVLEQYQIHWLVTKDGGKAGGFAEKLAAARQTGVSVLLVGRPTDTGESFEAILADIKEHLR